MTATGNATTKLNFYVDANKSGAPAEFLEYEGVKYRDVQDNLAFGLDFAATSPKNWEFVMTRRSELGTLLRNVIMKLNELRKRDGESKVDLIPFTPVIKQSDLTTDLSHSSKKFDELVKEVHTIFGQLKTVVNEINEREKNGPPAAAAVPADHEIINTPALSGSVVVHGGMEGHLAQAALTSMETALGKWWAEPWDGVGAIKKLVVFEENMMAAIGGRDHDFALKRVRALSNFEFQLITGTLKIPGIDEVTTAPNHVQAIARVQKLVSVEKEYKDFQTELSDEIKCNVPDIKAWVEAYASVYEAVERYIPEDFRKENSLLFKEFTEAYDRLVKFENHFKIKLDSEKEDLLVIQNRLDVWLNVVTDLLKSYPGEVHALVATIQKDKDALAAHVKTEAQIQGLFTASPPTEWLARIQELITFRDAVFGVIPTDMQGAHTPEEGFDLWSTDYQRLLTNNNYIKEKLGLKLVDTDESMKTRFDSFLFFIHDMLRAFGVTQPSEIKPIIDGIKTELGTGVAMNTAGSAIKLLKDEIAQLKASIANFEKDAGAAVATSKEDAAKQIKLLQTEKLRLETALGSCRTELTSAQNARDAAQTKIKSLEDAAAVAQGHIKSLEEAAAVAQARIKSLEDEHKKLETGAHVDLADPVKDLLERLQRLMNDHKHGGDPLVNDVSAILVGAFPTDATKDFIRRVVVKLEETIHPTTKARMRVLLAELEDHLKDEE